MTTIEAYHLIREVFNDVEYDDKFVMDLIANIYSEGYGKGYKEGREQQEKLNKQQE
jgi:hypothetical protein